MREETNPTWMEVHGGFARDMTMRDELAARAMAALLSHSGPYGEDQTPICREDVFTVDELAEYAYIQADSMLAAREAK
jgi:hypothetical protein